MKRVICADTDERKDRIDKFVSEFLEEPMVKNIFIGIIGLLAAAPMCTQ